MKKRILIADSDPLIRIYYELILREEGYETMSCETGEGAQKHLHEDFDLLITANRFPKGKIKGVDLCKKAKEIHPPIIVLLVTGGHAPSQHTADEVIEKPFKPSDFLFTVNNLIGGGE